MSRGGPAVRTPRIMERSYRESVRMRLRILFSPLRLTIFILANAWLLALNIIYIRNGAQQEWIGFISILPITGFAIWTMQTDRTYRNQAQRNGVNHP